MNANAAVDFIIRNAGDYSKAKAQRVFLEEFRKTKKALLMKDAMARSTKNFSKACRKP
jgi:hypothetical protein